MNDKCDCIQSIDSEYKNVNSNCFVISECFFCQLKTIE